MIKGGLLRQVMRVMPEAFTADQTARAQDLQMLRNGRLGNGELFGQGAHAVLAFQQQKQDVQAK